MSDAINPDHYKRLPAEAIEIIEAMIAGAPDNKAAYLHGQAAKYDLRLWEKGKSLEDYSADLGKHIWYALRLESHLLELIEKQNADEQQEASDLESLKDHPFGKLKEPAWTPKIGDWVKIKKPVDSQTSATSWWPSMDKYDGQIIQVKKIEEDGVVLEEWGFMFDWLEPAEPPKEQPQPPDGWRWLEVGEVIRKGDVDRSMEPVTNWWIGEACGHNHDLLRRNRFDIGEKVVHINDNPSIVYTVDGTRGDGAVIVSCRNIQYAISPNKLAPYIEDAK